MHIEDSRSTETDNNLQQSDFYTDKQDKDKTIETEFLNVSRGFIIKVCMLLAICLLFTLLAYLLSAYDESFKAFQQQDITVFILTIIISTAILLIFCNFINNTTKVPHNYILLGTFALCNAYIMSFSYSSTNLLTILTLTLWVIYNRIYLGVYTNYTKADRCFCVGLMICLGITTLPFAICAILIEARILYLFFAAVGTLVFSVHTIYDAQLIFKSKFCDNNYILAVLMLYIDVICFYSLNRLNNL
jgi:FtsH-binding integral membrane protein